MQDLFNNKVFLAPMAGVSDVAMRQLCIQAGAQLTYTEMVSTKALSFANEKTRHLLDLAPGEKRKCGVAVQIFGHEPDVMAAQAAYIEDELGENLALIDINMGCPARKIAGKGDGCALMLDDGLAQKIVASVVRATSHPITVKFRRGFFEGHETAPQFAKRMEDAGAACVCVHGRYAKQMYSGKSDLGCIARVVSAVNIPVIGNGDISCGADAARMLQETGCASVMIGRAARGNPWVFESVRSYLEQIGHQESQCAETGNNPESQRSETNDASQSHVAHNEFNAPTFAQRIEMARRHAKLLACRDEKRMVRMRKHAAWYVQGLPGARVARAKFNECETLQDFCDVFDELTEYLKTREQESEQSKQGSAQRQESAQN